MGERKNSGGGERKKIVEERECFEGERNREREK